MTGKVLPRDKLLTKSWALNSDLVLFTLLTVGSLLVYLRTLAPDVVDADGGEFQFAAWNFSIVHPTGYPLFLLLGGLFQHLVPFGNPAFRLNLFTAIAAAFAVGVLFLLVAETTHQRGAAAVSAVAFGLTRVFWYDAGAAEVYALTALFLALLMLIAFRWRAKPAVAVFALWCLVFGLSLTHHRMALLWMLPFVVFFSIAAWQVHTGGDGVVHAVRSDLDASHFSRLVPLFALCVAAPLLLYIYIPLRAPVSPYGVLALSPGRSIILYDSSMSGFVSYVLGRVFQSEIGWDATSLARLFAVPQLLIDQFGIAGILAGAAGFAAMVWNRDWTRLVLLAGLGAITLLFASLYHIGDIQHYYIPAFLVWAIWIGVGLGAMIRVAGSIRLFTASVAPLGVVVIGALLIPGYQYIFNYSAADRSGENPRAQWTRILSADIPENAVLLSNDRDDMMPLWYMQYVEGGYRGLLGLFPKITVASEYANIGRLTDSVLASGRPVYLIKSMQGLEIKYRLASSPNGLERIEGLVDAPAPPSKDTLVGDSMRVTGCNLSSASDQMRVNIFWQPLKPLDADYVTFVHVLDSMGNKVAQGNDHRVGGDFYPTSLWQVGETLRDEQVIRLPTALAPGVYQLLAGMYRASDGQQLGAPAIVCSFVR